jgi:hypothetical protein
MLAADHVRSRTVSTALRNPFQEQQRAPLANLKFD